MATTEWIIGRLYIKAIRNFLKQAKFEGVIEDFIESDGWVQHRFNIKGDPDNLEQVSRYLNSQINKC